MAKQEMVPEEPEEIPQQEIQREYSVEKSKSDLENNIKEMREGKIDVKEFIRRGKEALKKLKELEQSGKYFPKGTKSSAFEATEHLEDELKKLRGE